MRSEVEPRMKMQFLPPSNRKCHPERAPQRESNGPAVSPGPNQSGCPGTRSSPGLLGTAAEQAVHGFESTNNLDLGRLDRLNTTKTGTASGSVSAIGVFHAPMMALTYDPRKPLKTGQGSGGSKLTLCDLTTCPVGVECRCYSDAVGSALFREGRYRYRYRRRAAGQLVDMLSSRKDCDIIKSIFGSALIIWIVQQLAYGEDH